MKSPIICEHIVKGLLNVPADSQGYGIHVGESLYSREGQSVIIAGRREAGVINGCADFCALRHEKAEETISSAAKFSHTEL